MGDGSLAPRPAGSPRRPNGGWKIYLWKEPRANGRTNTNERSAGQPVVAATEGPRSDRLSVDVSQPMHEDAHEGKYIGRGCRCNAACDPASGCSAREKKQPAGPSAGWFKIDLEAISLR